MEEIKDEVVQNVLEADIMPFNPVELDNAEPATGKSMAAMIVTEVIKDVLIFMSGFCFAKVHSIRKHNKQVHECNDCDFCDRDDMFNDEDESTAVEENDD